jgi:hypothetical protein
MWSTLICRIIPQILGRTTPSTSFPVHCSLISVSLNAVGDIITTRVIAWTTNKEINKALSSSVMLLYCISHKCVRHEQHPEVAVVSKHKAVCLKIMTLYLYKRKLWACYMRTHAYVLGLSLYFLCFIFPRVYLMYLWKLLFRRHTANSSYNDNEHINSLSSVHVNTVN